MSFKKLSRLQVLLSATVVFAVVLGSSLWIVHHALTAAVQHVTAAANSTFTSALVNARWATLRPLLGLEAGAKLAPAQQRLPEIDAVVRAFAKDTDLVKVKIFNAQGLTLYSSDPAQVGQDESTNPEFQQAIRGRIATKLTYRGKFGAFGGNVYDRNLVSSYVPVRGPQGVEAVVEVYADRTASIDAVERQMVTLALLLGGLWLLGSAAIYLLAGAASRPQAPEAAAATQPAADRMAATATAASLADVGEELALASSELKGIASGLMDAPLDDAQQRSVERLAEIARRAALQAQAFTLHERMQRGDSVTNRAPMDLKGLLAHASSEFERRARARNLRPLVYLSPKLPEAFTGDRDKLGELLDALASTVVHRAVEGTVQFKAQLGAGSIQVDLISAEIDTPRHKGLDLRRLAILARAAGALLEVRTHDADGDWLSVSLALAPEQA